MSRSIFRVVVFLLFAFAYGQAAEKTKLSYKLLAIHVKGLNHFHEDQIIAASGLRLGQFASEEQFKQAIDKLGQTGFFSHLTYAYQYSPEGCNLEVQVAENEKLVPILFDNFVWFPDDELLSLLHARLPLFDGQIPLGGNFGDQISQALNSILAERRIFALTEYVPFGPLNGSIESYVYKVNFRPILVRKIEFPGAASSEVPALEAAARPLSGQDYLRSQMRIQQRLNFLPVYHAKGYLKAQFADVQAKIAEDGPETVVDVASPVTPGLQYKLTKIQWAGNVVFPAERLQQLVHLKPGEPANAVQLDEDLEQVKKLYGTKGYVFAHISPVPEMDDALATVGYNLNVTEGDLYRMGKLEIDGIDPESAKKMASQWQMKAGDPFDDSYLSRFFKTMYHDVGLRDSWNIVPKRSVNQQDKTISVSLHFLPKT